MINTPDETTEEFYKPAQIAKKLGINVMLVYHAISDGELVAYQLGKGYRIRPEDYDAWIESRRGVKTTAGRKKKKTSEE